MKYWPFRFLMFNGFSFPFWSVLRQMDSFIWFLHRHRFQHLETNYNTHFVIPVLSIFRTLQIRECVSVHILIRHPKSACCPPAPAETPLVLLLTSATVWTSTFSPLNRQNLPLHKLHLSFLSQHITADLVFNNHY